MDSNADHFCKTEISTEPPKAEAFSRPWKSSDLVIKVASRKFHVHRAVLIICSPVFEAMLSSNFKEKFAPERPLPGKDAKEIEKLLQGIYPDEIYLSQRKTVSPL